ncbi:hypothetical protein HYFRA_00012842 [Hymenoscyphus fraxineus]|uniref:Uncharacterized protein n=1 Tax=Hymenoscyphus fraxineus TaxID=746836 RepID=A0A9N9PTE8_9HELO|nr:hypothetical protein HYFRA_00012842 [Hymenoscyphus fraxineus]
MSPYNEERRQKRFTGGSQTSLVTRTEECIERKMFTGSTKRNFSSIGDQDRLDASSLTVQAKTNKVAAPRIVVRSPELGLLSELGNDITDGSPSQVHFQKRLSSTVDVSVPNMPANAMDSKLWSTNGNGSIVGAQDKTRVSTLLKLPTELLLMIFDALQEIDGTHRSKYGSCSTAAPATSASLMLGLTCIELYDIHWNRHGPVNLAIRPFALNASLWVRVIRDLAFPAVGIHCMIQGWDKPSCYIRFVNWESYDTGEYKKPLVEFLAGKQKHPRSYYTISTMASDTASLYHFS